MSAAALMSRSIFFMRPRVIYEQIKKHAIESVPFARHAGVVVTDAGRGSSQAQLAQRPEVMNHVGTLHAAALYALGEAASGVAMAGAIAPIVMAVKPVAAEASIRYLKPARGTITAQGRVDGDPDALVDEIRSQGKARFDVAVTLSDEDKVVVAEMKVQWHAKLKS